MSGRSVRGDPERIGRFRLAGRIGRGAMGIVYAADDEVMGRRVALKVLIADLESDPDTRARFYREALTAARVIHPNVITIFDAGEDAGRSFIAMQLLNGLPLAQYLETSEAAPLERKLDLMMQMCEGLSAAHAQQVVHRDLKPSNLFVQSDGLLKILDFGIARLAGSNMTAAGTVLGTPDYMSPEQARGTQVTASSDIFSAGAVFYFMLSGHKPFKGPDLKAVLRQLASADLDPLPSSVPPELAAIVLGAMAKDPASRPARIEDLLSALVRFRRTYVAETRKLVVSARSLHATLLDLVQEVRDAGGPLGVDPAPDATQTLAASFAPLAPGAGADVRPVDRGVVDEVISQLVERRSELNDIRDARRAQATAVSAGRDSLAAGDALAALSTFEAVLAELPSSPVVKDLIEATRPQAAEQEARQRRLAARVNAARRAIEERDWQLAIRECQQALSLMPAHEETQALLAHARAGHAEEHRHIAERVSECLDSAGAAIEARAFDDAAAALDKVDALQPGLPDSVALRRRLIDERATAEAEAVLQRVVAEEIRHARAAFRRGRADEAVHQLRGFMEIEPRAEALSGELERLEQLRETWALAAAAASRAAAEHVRRATQCAEMGLLDDAVASAQQALAADPTDVAAGELLEALLVRVFEARVEREKERLAQQRLACAQPAVDAARRALEAGYIEFASRAAAVAGRIAPASTDVRALADAATEQMEGEDQELVELGPTPFESVASESRVPPPAAGVAIEPLRFERAIGMFKSVFSKSAPAAPRRQGDRR